MKSKWDAFVTASLVVCALTTTGFVVYRQFVAPSANPVLPPTQKTVFIKSWESHLDPGVLLGSSRAPVKLIEFADFECPFCASFHETLKTVRDRYPSNVSLSFVHYPIPGHRFAEPAARVAECADQQGRFEAMHDRLFEEQRKLGLKPWSELASEAEVADLAAFDTCIKSTLPVPRIEAGKKLGDQLSIQGTPTLIINGWKLANPPTVEELDQMVQSILAGKSPVS